MTYSLQPLNLCRAGQTGGRVAVSHSDIMTGARCKLTGRHLASPQRGHKEGDDASRLAGCHQMPVADRHAINTVWQTMEVPGPRGRHTGFKIKVVSEENTLARFIKRRHRPVGIKIWIVITHWTCYNCFLQDGASLKGTVDLKCPGALWPKRLPLK